MWICEKIISESEFFSWCDISSKCHFFEVFVFFCFWILNLVFNFILYFSNSLKSVGARRRASHLRVCDLLCVSLYMSVNGCVDFLDDCCFRDYRIFDFHFIFLCYERPLYESRRRKADWRFTAGPSSKIDRAVTNFYSGKSFWHSRKNYNKWKKQQTNK